jgi:hypothetical protein
MTLSSQMGPDMHLHVVHRLMVAWAVSFVLKFLWKTNGRSKVAKARIGTNQVHRSHCMGVPDGCCKHNGWYNANYHVLCAFRCLRTRSSNSRRAGKINGCSVVVNTSNDEKQVCSVHHGAHKNSYSPCGGWYNASTGALVALVTQCFDTFCVGIWPKMVKIKKQEL